MPPEAIVKVKISRHRKVVPPKIYDPPAWNNVDKKSKKVCHDDFCFCCNDGGDLVLCGRCPKVYHIQVL